MNASALLQPLWVHAAYLWHTSTFTNTVPAVITESDLHHNFNSRHLPETLPRPKFFFVLFFFPQCSSVILLEVDVYLFLVLSYVAYNSLRWLIAFVLNLWSIFLTIKHRITKNRVKLCKKRFLQTKPTKITLILSKTKNQAHACLSTYKCVLDSNFHLILRKDNCPSQNGHRSVEKDLKHILAF